MDDHNVERAVLLQGGYLGFQNLYSWQAQQKWPDRFLAAGAYEPLQPQPRRHRPAPV